jgi:hypothetical protein
MTARSETSGTEEDEMKPIRHRMALAGGVAMLAMVVACGTNEPETDDMTDLDMTTDEGLTPAAEQAPVTLMGCLQETGSDFVLTTMNTPPAGSSSDAVGTTGRTSAESTAGTTEGAGAGDVTSGAPPPAEHMSAARQTYRLEGDDDNLRTHVGAQVRIMGTLEETASDPVAGGDISERTDISSGDLAAVQVTSVQRVAETCGESTSTPATP